MKAVIGLLALAVAACGVVPSTAATHAATPADPTRFATILAALQSDLVKVQADRAHEEADITFGLGNPAGACYNLWNNVRYDVLQRLNHDARVNTLNDRTELQTLLNEMRGELVNLQNYNRAFGNNLVAPFGGHWATDAIAAMWTTMQMTEGAANNIIDLANGTVAAGFQRYRKVWQVSHCASNKLLAAVPLRVPHVSVEKLPPPTDP
jgi:hypothetical protein